MIATILQTIEEAIKPIEQIKYINEDWGQLVNYVQPPVSWPCVLLECEDIGYSSIGRNAQQARATIAVHVADYRDMKQGNARTDTRPRYGMFELLEAINKKLHGLSGASFSPLVRQGTKRQGRDDGIREFVILYACAFTDTSTVKSVQEVKATPVVSVGRR